MSIRENPGTQVSILWFYLITGKNIKKYKKKIHIKLAKSYFNNNLLYLRMLKREIYIYWMKYPYAEMHTTCKVCIWESKHFSAVLH